MRAISRAGDRVVPHLVFTLLRITTHACFASPDKEIAEAAVELLRERTVKLPSLTASTGSARFALVFEASNQPRRAEYLDGECGTAGSGRQTAESDLPGEISGCVLGEDHSPGQGDVRWGGVFGGAVAGGELAAGGGRAPHACQHRAQNRGTLVTSHYRALSR